MKKRKGGKGRKGGGSGLGKLGGGKAGGLSGGGGGKKKTPGAGIMRGNQPKMR
jgi:hypothetical protein